MAETFTARVIGVADLTHDVRELRLRLITPPRIEFLPGQFVSFEIERPGARFKATRAYSVVSTPDTGDVIHLLLNRVPEGPGSEYLFGLAAGHDTRFRGPFGTFTLPAEGTRELLFDATDTGIAPLWSMLWWLAAHDPARRVTLIWGLPASRDVYYREELARLREMMPDLSAVVALSDPDDTWTGATGDVRAQVATLAADVSGLEVFICGGSVMIADVTAIIKSRGTCPIHKEQYYRG